MINLTSREELEQSAMIARAIIPELEQRWESNPTGRNEQHLYSVKDSLATTEAKLAEQAAA